ncbi:MAG: DNA translocase FtsK [Flavobacteriia bacterium]|nr:DNA translocase FtsK [Flavobacteriia bacterium]OIP48254.1 MAG: cell division protein FtsK [Flavobacteriaceae bacterium CG2_30_31_66]PIV96629.1 MAG: cell division protein FtsK [Flavobacteriaceae bacterium CG17_big_fil_post_rev_8_21_14_2_50_31_13]PIY14464.1 MAG: cell division protein FtsK [Flavobacteriaceae bacterium CG_4_10_14_3_um_filter_31_253]PIZ10051.1 MAG: cell division protein FtsK [Flavobacteriaceae bacterium CG_4_10_14_0_8_um_filter_31_99]PJC09509.1 MAG: cell division protein FtsK [F
MTKEKISKKKTNSTVEKRSFFAFLKTRQAKTLLATFLMLFAIFLFSAFISFFFNWQEDQSTVKEFFNRKVATNNLLGKVGANLSHFFIYQGFGLASFIITYKIFATGYFILLKQKLSRIILSWNWGIISMIWISVTLGFLPDDFAIFSGIVGVEVNEFLQAFIGKTGLIIGLLFMFIGYLVVRYKITFDEYIENLKRKREERTLKKEAVLADKTEEKVLEIPIQKPTENTGNTFTLNTNKKSTFERPFENLKPTISSFSDISNKKEPEISLKVEEENVPPIHHENVEIDIEKVEVEEQEIENLSDKLLKDFGEFDPTLELSNFRFPSFNLLKQYNESISIDPNELEANKNNIVETLKNYGIGISEIKATVGPTITLYEIVPDAGIRISKIKNLEDDIALSLSALGIRIIAPMPGKGTIGIEVPNKRPTIVSMYSAISSKRFQESQMELPIALGKTISNETFVVDLAKMPHLLMAGATGQGKSVGLNAVLTSLLYKKHPAEVKFVLVDPKKVELTLFNKIERHYLAKLPDTEEAIITDTHKVINTLNSLCIEMDNRYDLLKAAMVRNIKEYNEKFKKRKLNPNEGHQFLPYIVLVIDEFADLIMTAGKEVETPIARLAQLARAIGIHLIVATQRPSVNVITGIIKANFPSRIAFRVTSKIDSRTILDAPGADQLVGRGDMLYSAGNELIRIQCAFVDTPEIEKITDYIGSQKAYPDAYQLPEFVGEEGGTNLDNNIEERDKLFREAAEIIITSQQGSASLLQRKLKLGYNRAGRLIDQLEAAGIVGPFEGSKARQVLISDFMSLEQLLENEKNG